MKLSLFILPFISVFAFAVEFNYNDRTFGNYRLVTTDKNISMKVGLRDISFPIRECNKKLVSVYLSRVNTSLRQLRPAQRPDVQNRVTMKGKIFRASLSSPAAAFFRNLPGETYYLQKMQAQQCRTGRVPAQVDPHGVTKKLEQINDQLGKPSIETNCTDCDSRMIDMSDLFSDCAKTICDGEKSDRLPDLAGENEFAGALAKESTAAKEFDSQYLPKLKAIVSKTQELRKAGEQKYLKMLENPPKEISDVESLRFYEALVEDVDALMSVQGDLSDEEKMVLTKTLNSPEMEKKWMRYREAKDPRVELNSLTPKETLSQLAPARNLTLSAQTLATQTLKKMKTVGGLPQTKGANSETLFPGVRKAFLEKVAKGGVLDDFGVATLVTNHLRVDLLERGLSSSEYQKNLQDLGSAILKENEFMESYGAAKFDENISGAGGGAFRYQQDQYMMLNCKAGYAVQISAAPSSTVIRQAKKTETQVKKRVQDLVLPKFSKETAAKLLAKSRTWKFVYPSTPDQVKNQFADQFLAASSTLELVKPMALGRENSALLSDVTNFCDINGDLAYPIHDKTNTTMGEVIVSREVVKFPVLANSILAHEMGHLISKEIGFGDISDESRKKFSDIQRCLSLKHGTDSKELYVEEDFADQVAHLANPQQEQNPWCSNFKGLNPQFSLSGAGDRVHSSFLFRLLFQEYARHGQLPKICTEGLKKYGTDIDFSKCM